MRSLLSRLPFKLVNFKIFLTVFSRLTEEHSVDLSAIFKYVSSHNLVMPNITLSIPEDVYKRMKKYREVKWSEVVRKAIVEYLKRLEEGGFEETTGELLDELGEGFKESLKKLSFEDALSGYEKMRDAEWKRSSMTRAS